MEVGDEIRNVSVAYGAQEFEDDSASGDSSGKFKGDEDDGASGDSSGKFKGDEEGQESVRERQLSAYTSGPDPVTLENI